MALMKECPYCSEQIRASASICKFCHSSVADDPEGKYVKVRLKSHDKIYSGNLFVPHHLNRVTDTINDERQFIILTQTKEEGKLSDIHIGFIAINKNSIEWVRLVKEEGEPEEPKPTIHHLR